MAKDSYKHPVHIIITGASSGIGRALALEYADKSITLGLIGRNKERLEKVAGECFDRGANVETLICDVTEYETLNNWVWAFDRNHPVDLVISNAGISSGPGHSNGPESMDNITALFDINVLGAINAGQCLYEPMKQRGGGQIAFTGSIAGFQSWAGAPAYAATKSALHSYAEGMAARVKKDNIFVSIIAPGFVKSAMTDKNEFPMPFKMSAEDAARIIKSQLRIKKNYIIFPKKMYALSLIYRFLPIFLTSKITQFIKSKN